jgi:glycosyltransferase involved in cell wall biosynthesis
MDSLTVIIPTFNRARVLKLALGAYFVQSSPNAIRELIVVDDGSTDGTDATVDEMSRLSPFPIRYLRQSNSGPAAARNFGIREARANLVLFTDSDIAPDRDFVAQHLEWHNRHPQANIAVLGYVTWPPQPPPTPFMRWYGETQLFSYRQIRHKQLVDFTTFYSCNLSLKTDFIRIHGQFDESFKTAAYEDIELGYRLGNAGLQLLYNARAVAYHHQFVRFADACRRSHENSAASRIFFDREAGQYLLRQRAKTKSRVAHRIAKWVATGIATSLDPARKVLDSDFRLPASVYRLLFWHCTARGMELDDPALS